MIDFAWSEFLFIAALALILIGPKELPTVLRYVGRMVGKVRALAKELSSQLDLNAPIDSKDAESQDEIPKDTNS